MVNGLILFNLLAITFTGNFLLAGASKILISTYN